MELLKVVEDENDYYVIYADSELDWVAKFNKSWWEAKSWAYHMADLYNNKINNS